MLAIAADARPDADVQSRHGHGLLVADPPHAYCHGEPQAFTLQFISEPALARAQSGNMDAKNIGFEWQYNQGGNSNIDLQWNSYDPSAFCS